ncbi:MAG: insulinase family protein [Aureispira sp.]|nr:insulinase family protein [Aureispira sp.]
MIDRSKAPVIQSVKNLKLHQPEVHLLSNGIPLYEIALGSQEIIKLDILFDAGRWYEQAPLVARATAQLLKAGTQTLNAKELAEKFEFYGAKLKIYDGFDDVNIRLYCLSKHLDKLLPIVEELFTQPAFPEDELQKFIKRNQQSLKVQLQKGDVVAYRQFTEQLFGDQHPYGYNSNMESYGNLSIPLLKEHFDRCYTANQCKIIVAGKTSPNTLKIIDQHLGNIPNNKLIVAPNLLPLPPKPEKSFYQNLNKGNVQASIRIGCRMFDRRHIDYHAFYIVNTILGGYFGARLMQNLREEKGYTYGIYSSMEALRHSGYFYICTDVASDVKDLALTEIYLELERLQQEAISTGELEMVKNYTLGMLLNGIDGIFNISNLAKDMIACDLDHDFFDKMVDTVQNISPQTILDIAQKYFDRSSLCEVIVE